MQKHLFFICPSDSLEGKINMAYSESNLFISSIGNSIVFDHSTSSEINSLIGKQGIAEITFILSTDNRIIQDACNEQRFRDIKGMQGFYAEITKHKELAERTWQGNVPTPLVSSMYLQCKQEELLSSMNRNLIDQIKVNHSIYYRRKSRFLEITPELLRRSLFCLN